MPFLTEYLKKLNNTMNKELLSDKKLFVNESGILRSKDTADYDSDGNIKEPFKLYDYYRKQSETAKDIQNSLNALGFTDKDGKELKADGDYAGRVKAL